MLACARQPETPEGRAERRRRRRLHRRAGVGHHRRQGPQGAARHDGARRRPAARHPHPDALPPPGPLRGRRVPGVRGRGREPADAAGGVRLPGDGADQGPHAHAEGPPGPPPRDRPAALHALRRVLQLQAQQQLRAAVAGEGIRRRLLPLRPRDRVPLPGGPIQLLGRAGHGQVHPLPPVRPHLHRPAGGGRARGRRPRRPDADLDLPRQAARRRGLHQLRAVHQPLPDRRPARQRRVRRGLARDRRPEEARGHPDRAQPAGRDRRVLRPRAGHAADLPDEHRAPAVRLRQGVRHQLHRRPDDPRRGDRAAAAAARRRW